MNKIELTVWMGMTVRNILLSPVIKNLLNNFEIDIHTTFRNEFLKRKDLDQNKIDFRDIHISNTKRRLSRVLYQWNYHALWQQHHPSTMEKYILQEKSTRSIKYLFNYLGGYFVQKVRNKKETDWLRDVSYRIPINHKIDSVDALLVTSTDLIKDQILMYSYKKLGIPIVALVHSWDNLPSRGLLAVEPDRMLVWNEYMVQDALKYHNIPKEKIDIVGVPQFELYRKNKSNINLDSYKKSLQIDKECKVITYTASATRVFPDEPLFIEELLKIINKGTFGNAILLLRLHPTERTLLYSSIYKNTDLPIRLDIPDSGFSANTEIGLINDQGIDNFISLIQVSDVVINLASTITLDAILFDKPVICPKFNLSIPKNSWNAAHKWYKSSHFIHISNSEAVSMPKNMDDLVNELLKYLDNPLIKSRERNKLKQKMIPEIPTGKLVAESVQYAIN